jgi:hypothetical protein
VEMEINYSIGSSRIKRVSDKAGFMLCNGSGNYAYFSSEARSRYQGFFVNNKSGMFRVIESINLVNKSEILKLKNNISSAERINDEGIVESFFVPKKLNSLVYELNKEEEIELVLDVKKSYDNRQFGRIYNIEINKDKIIVSFTKRKDSGEDGSDDEEFSLYLVIKSDRLNYEIIDNWARREYPDDEERNSKPFERYVYFALRLKAKNFVFSVSDVREKAIKEAKYVYDNREKLKSSVIENSFAKKIKDKKIKLAYISALNSLEGLRFKSNKEEGLFAGLPWFFQLWSRDELISLKGVKDKSLIKNILMRYYFRFKQGKLESKPESNLNSCDAVGWLYFRTKQAIDAKIFNVNELKKIKDILSLNIGDVGFAECSEKESWMDTLDRKGALIELQALKLFSYNLLFNLTKDKKYRRLEEELKEQVRIKFWNGSYLADNLNEDMIRPNLFIAAYVYPELLSKKEWIKCFDNVLPRLFLDFGGLSTVDKTHFSFNVKHTGENPTSYHNGDSWCWINNLAAIVLNRIDKKKYASYIKKILDASVKEILFSGIIGSSAELSSAEDLRSEGCLNQAWSNAMFIELVEELF